MRKAVAKGEVIMSAEYRAKNNGLKLHASTSKTQRLSLTMKIGTAIGYLKSLLNFPQSVTVRTKSVLLYDYISNKFEVDYSAFGTEG